MPSLHMETTIVLSLVQQIKQTAEQAREQAAQVNNTAHSLDWIGPSHDEFMAEAQAIARAIEAQADVGEILATRVEREIAEWEQAAANLGGSNGVVLPISGGIGSWKLPALPFSNLTPIFTIVTIAPWVGSVPSWLGDLYHKFFPAPISLPEVIAPEPEVPATGSVSLFGKLIERGQAEATTAAQPAVPTTPSAQVTPVTPSTPPAASSAPSSQPTFRTGYEPFYDISPKSQDMAFGKAACLPTSLSMLTDYYHNQDPANKAVDRDELIKMREKGDGTPGVGFGVDKLNDDLNELGYKTTKNSQSDMNGLADELKNGPLVVNVKVKLVSAPERTMSEGNSYNHSILIKGISDTNVLINDPWSGKEMEIPTDQFERMWKNGGNWVQVVRP